MSPAVARKIQNLRYRKWGSYSRRDTCNEKLRSKSLECLDTNSYSYDAGGEEDDVHPSQASLPQEPQQGRAGSPDSSEEGPMDHYEHASITGWQKPPLYEQNPPPTEDTEDSLAVERSQSKVSCMHAGSLYHARHIM